jgi:hypothetical protein
MKSGQAGEKRVLLAGMVLATAALLPAAGCNWIQAGLIATTPDPVEHVSAEYEGLAEQRVVIVVEAEMETLFDFPRIRRQVAEQIAYNLDKHVSKVHVVPAKQVEEYRQRGYRTEYEAAHKIGEHFGASRVLRVELLTFATREEASAGLFRGRVDAMLAVYDVEAKNPTDPPWQGRLQVHYPPGSPLTPSQATEQQIYSRTVSLLGERVAQKFYDHDEAL